MIEKAMRERWIKDEEGWRKLPARAWPEYQPEAAEIPQLQEEMKKLCSPSSDGDLCADVTFNLATALIFNNVDTNKGLHLYKSLAAQGDARGACGAGVCLVEGYGVDPDEELGATYIQQACAAGYAQGIFELASLLYAGNAAPYVPEDVGKAYQLFEKAAELDHTAALYMQADCLMNGEGCEQDRAKAVGLLYRAGERGHRFARATLLNLLHEKSS